MKGFTLMEIMIVIALIMILSVVGIGAFMQSTVKSRDTQRKSNLNQIGKAAEAFYTDVGHYPLSDDVNTDRLYCYDYDQGVDTICTGTKLYNLVDSTMIVYLDVPKDPDALRKYVYESSSDGYSLYAALENSQDRDLLLNGDGSVNQNPWGVSCGSVQCNYKIIETGLVKSI